MSNICHICGRDIVSPVDPVCGCAEEMNALRARVEELEAAGREVAEMVNEIIEKAPEAHAIIRSHATKATTFKR